MAQGQRFDLLSYTSAAPTALKSRDGCKPAGKVLLHASRQV
jgi:hypothetical protein